MLPLALTDVAATLGLVGIFFVLFPLLAHVLVGFSIAQALGERMQNQEYRRHKRKTG